MGFPIDDPTFKITTNSSYDPKKQSNSFTFDLSSDIFVVAVTKRNRNAE